MTSEARLGVPAAIALVVGGGYGLVVMAYGLYWVASATSPESFGLDFSSDGRAGPESAQFAVFVALIGVGVVAAAIRTAIHGKGWQLSAACFVLVIALSAGWAHASRDTRRCAYNTYRDRPNERCRSELAAELRDFTILAVPPLVGLSCLVVSRPRSMASERRAAPDTA